MSMRKTIHHAALAAGVATFTVGFDAIASSHREAPAISTDPCADNTDLWAWVERTGTSGYLYVVASYNPLEEPAGGPNFNMLCDDVLYEIHIARGAGKLNDKLTYQFRFQSNAFPYVDVANMAAPAGGGKEFFYQLAGQSQTMDVIKIEGGTSITIADNVPVAPVDYGPRTDAVLKALGARTNDSYDEAFFMSFIRPTDEGGRVFAGPTDDGFYVDLGGVFDLANFRQQGEAQDGVAGYNVHTIALEIPLESLTGTGEVPGTTPGNDTLLGIWASASRRHVTILRNDGSKDYLGPWKQVSRLGFPLINEAVVGLQDKDKYNRTRPSDDVKNFGAYFLNPILVRDAEVVGVYAQLGVDPTPFKTNRADILGLVQLNDLPAPGTHTVPITMNGGETGDVLRVDMALDYTELGFPNGRPIPGGPSPDQEQADVTDVIISYFLLKDPSRQFDNVLRNDKPYLAYFPYLNLPFRSFDGGHGKPTP